MEYEEIKSKVFSFEKVGDSIEGELIDVSEGKFGMDYVIQKDNEDYTIFGTAVLRNKMKSVKIGEYVKITFEGLVEGKNENPYKNWKVEKAISEKKV